jgi:hypothetical protein
MLEKALKVKGLKFDRRFFRNTRATTYLELLRFGLTDIESSVGIDRTGGFISKSEGGNQCFRRYWSDEMNYPAASYGVSKT